MPSFQVCWQLYMAEAKAMLIRLLCYECADVMIEMGTRLHVELHYTKGLRLDQHFQQQ